MPASFLIVLTYCVVSSSRVYQVGESYVKPILNSCVTFKIPPSWKEKPLPIVDNVLSKSIAVIKPPLVLSSIKEVVRW